MCGRYTITAELSDILSDLSVDESNIDYAKRYNIAPTQQAPVVLERDGKRVLKTFRWGLIPFWAKDKKIGYKTINARSETVHQKPAFRHLIKKNRLIVVSDGFYEWKEEESGKQPYRFQLERRGVFAFAGLYDTWTDPDGEENLTFTIITTTPNRLVKNVHDRMPVILDDDAVAKWLNPKITDNDDILNILAPYPAERMTMYPVSKEVGSVKNSSPALIEEVSLNSK